MNPKERKIEREIRLAFSSLILPVIAMMFCLAIYAGYVAGEPQPPPQQKQQHQQAAPQAKPAPPRPAQASLPSWPESHRFDYGTPAPEEGTAHQRQLAASEAAKDQARLRKAFDQVRDADPAIRASAAECLGAEPNASAEAALIPLLSSDPDAKVREAAARSLAAFEPPSAQIWRVLLASIKDKSADVQSMSIHVLQALLSNRAPRDPYALWMRQEIRALQASPALPEPVRESLQVLLVGEDNAQR